MATKKLSECTYAEVKAYLGRNWDIDVALVFAGFNKCFLKTEENWADKVKNSFPKIFKKSFLDKTIEIPEEK